MDDFSALARRVATAGGDVHACQIMSRDGLILGDHPREGSDLAREAWLRFSALGTPEKSFVEFADQLWAYVQRGPYAAFAVASPTVRPGLLIDQMERALLSAEEGRSRREQVKLLELGQAPAGKPRSPLHLHASRPATEGTTVPARASKEPDQAAAAPVPEDADVGTDPPKEVMAAPDDAAAEAPAGPAGEETAEVDRVILAQEFYGLLQMQDGTDEGSS